MATPHIYPGADTKSQWFASAYQGDTMPHPNVIVLHTTEGSSWPSYGGGSQAPTFTVQPDGRVRQHFPANMSARALVNKPGGVETNTLNVVQIELVGTCAKGGPGVFWPTATDAQLAGLAKLVTWLAATYPIPLKSTARKWLAYPSSYGSAGGQRMTASEWEGFSGLCGHQHVPENDHGDPGNFPIARLLQAAQTPTTTTPVKETSSVATISDADARKIATTVLTIDGVIDNPNPATAETNKFISLETSVRNLETVARRTEAKLDALLAALQTKGA
jgi:hypothetical protein